MFQTAIGRIQSIIEYPPRTLDMWVFLDAGGKAGKQRVWGGLAAIGDSELGWIESVIKDIDSKNNTDSELKGHELDLEVIKAAGKKIKIEDRRVIFWANWLPDWRDQKSQNCSRYLGDFLASLRPNSSNLNYSSIESMQSVMAGCYSGLKDVNKHKIMSIIMHLQWLIEEINRRKLGDQLKSVKLVIDNENFPSQAIECGVIVKSFFAAGLQHVGMDCSLTGTAFREKPNEGSVSVDLLGNSGEVAGIRYVDVLLQAVLRKVMPL